MAVLVMMFDVIEPASAIMQRSDEPEDYGGFSRIFRAVLGGTIGFLIYGSLGAFAGAGLMAITDTHRAVMVKLGENLVALL